MRWADLNDEAVENVDRALRAPRQSGFSPTWRAPDAPVAAQDAPTAVEVQPDARQTVSALVARLRAGDHSARDLLARFMAFHRAPTSDRPSDQPADDLPSEGRFGGGVNERSDGGPP